MPSSADVLGKREAEDDHSTPPKRPKLPDTVKDALTCPICYEWMTGHIYQCTEGHVVCATCIGKLPIHETVFHETVDADYAPHIRACAECRGAMDVTRPVRNRLVEGIRDEVALPCPNEGCSEELRVAEYDRHAEHDCPMRPSRKGVYRGDRYDSQWKDGAPDGEGTVYRNNSPYVTYSGQLKQGHSHGEGTVYHKNSPDVAYSGQWTIGLPHGEGTEHWSCSNRVKYKGQWKAGLRDGTGILYYKDGTHTKYVGNWKEGTFDGHGAFYTGATGGHTRLYKGEWKWGTREGTGTRWRASGKFAYRGEWHDDARHGEGTEYDTNGAVKYDGQWRRGFRDGHGKRFRPDGSPQYDGEWKLGKKHGLGTTYSADKESVRSRWVDGLRVEEGAHSPSVARQ
jgi:antitoxin component YwqK of YwqJK toxin-antitoxin module